MTLHVLILPPVRLSLLELGHPSTLCCGRHWNYRRPALRLATMLLALFLAQSWCPLSGQSPATLSGTAPSLLSDPELRLVLGQLYELKALRLEVKELQANQAAEAKQAEAERAL